MAVVTPTVQQAAWRVRLNLTVAAGSNRAEVERSADAGASWTFVRGDDPNGNAARFVMTSQAATVYDAEAPLDVPLVYRARGLNTVSGAVEDWSPVSASVTLAGQDCVWVIAAVDNPSAVWAGTVEADPGYAREAPRGTFYRLPGNVAAAPDSAGEPVVVFGKRQGAKSEGLSWIAKTNTEARTIEQVVGQDQVMCVRAPASVGWSHPYVMIPEIKVDHRPRANSGRWVVSTPWVAVSDTDTVTLRALPQDVLGAVASITTPTSGAQANIGTTVTVSGTAAPGSGGSISSVKVLVDGVVAQTLTTPPLTVWSVALTGLTLGAHTITAIAADPVNGDGPTSNVVTLTVVNPAANPPTATLTAPTNGGNANEGTSVTIAGTASTTNAGASLVSVKVYVDAVLFATVTTITAGVWTMTTTALPAGTHTITAATVDSAYGEGPQSAGRTWTVNATFTAGIGGWTAGEGIASSSGGGTTADLLTGDSKTFEGGTVGQWTSATNATVVNSTAQAHTGTRSLLVTSTTAGAAFFAASAVAAQPGETFNITGWAKIGGATQRVVQFIATWKDSGGASIRSDYDSGTVLPTTGAWTALSGAPTFGPAPAGTATVILNAQFTSATIGETLYLDDLAAVASGAPGGGTTGPIASVVPTPAAYSGTHAGQYAASGSASGATYLNDTFVANAGTWAGFFGLPAAPTVSWASTPNHTAPGSILITPNAAGTAAWGANSASQTLTGAVEGQALTASIWVFPVGTGSLDISFDGQWYGAGAGGSIGGEVHVSQASCPGNTWTQIVGPITVPVGTGTNPRFEPRVKWLGTAGQTATQAIRIDDLTIVDPGVVGGIATVYDEATIPSGASTLSTKVMIYAVTAARTAGLRLGWYSAAGALLGTTLGNTTTAALGAWTALDITNQPIIANATKVRLTVAVTSPAANDTFRIDQAVIVTGATAPPSTPNGETTPAPGNWLSLQDQEFYGSTAINGLGTTPPPQPPPVTTSGYAYQLLMPAGGMTENLDRPHVNGAPVGTVMVNADVYNGYRRDPATGKWATLIRPSGYPAIDLPESGWSTGTYGIAQAPSNPLIVYAAIRDRVLKSSDGGITWADTTLFTITGGLDGNVDGRMIGPKIAVDPRDPNHVLLGTPLDGLWRTINGGTSWARVASVPVGSPGDQATWTYALNGIGFNPLSAATGTRTSEVMVLVNADGGYISTDGAATFTRTSGGPTTTGWGYWGPRFGATTSGDYFCSEPFAKVGVNAVPKIWRYRAGTWTAVRTYAVGNSDRQWWSLAVAPDAAHAGTVVIADVQGTIQKTTDGGTTWTNALTNPSGGYTFSSTGAQPAWLGAVTNQFFTLTGMLFEPGTTTVWGSQGAGVWKADIANLPTSIQWVTDCIGLSEIVTTRITPMPASVTNNRVLVSGWDMGIWRNNLVVDQYPAYHDHRDGTGHPYFCSAWDVTIDPLNPLNVFGLWTDHQYQLQLQHATSTDGGLTWTKCTGNPVGPGPGSYGFGCAAISGNAIVWAGAPHVNPYYSLDRGATWTACNLPGVTTDYSFGGWAIFFTRHIVCADPGVAGKFYLYGGDQGLWVSTNSGVSWTKIRATQLGVGGEFHSSLKGVPGQAGHLMFTMGGQSGGNTNDAFFTADGAVTWGTIPGWKEIHAFGFGQPATSGAYPAIYAAGYYNTVWGIYRCFDFNPTTRTGTWTRLMAHIPDQAGDSIADISGVFGATRVGEFIVGARGSGAYWARPV